MFNYDAIGKESVEGVVRPGETVDITIGYGGNTEIHRLTNTGNTAIHYGEFFELDKPVIFDNPIPTRKEIKKIRKLVKKLKKIINNLSD